MNPLLWGILLWLWKANQRKPAARAPSSTSSAPAAPAALLTPTIPLASDAELLEPPEDPSAEDLLWARYASDPKRPGPRLTLDKAPVSRKLTPFERWALKPYFPVASDLNVTIHNGVNPRAIDPKEQAKADQLFKDNPRLWALTLQLPGKKVPQIYFPGGKPRPLGSSRWWLGVLAHEITHVAQFRMGMTAAQTTEAFLKYGYVDSPIERQARHFQATAHRDLYERARKFYAPK